VNVGIFFKVANDFLVDAVPLEAGEPYGDAVQHGGHYDFHELLRPAVPTERLFKAHDYDYYPRGRVVYFPKRRVFALYADPCMTPGQINRVIDLFGLGGQTVELTNDEHYRCSRCNKSYLE
jgi:hypothetical protein